MCGTAATRSIDSPRLFDKTVTPLTLHNRSLQVHRRADPPRTRSANELSHACKVLCFFGSLCYFAMSRSLASPPACTCAQGYVHLKACLRSCYGRYYSPAILTFLPPRFYVPLRRLGLLASSVLLCKSPHNHRLSSWSMQHLELNSVALHHRCSYLFHHHS